MTDEETQIDLQNGKGSERRQGENAKNFDKGYVGIHWPSRDEQKPKRRQKMTSKKGFTFIELLVLAAIIAILAGLLLPILRKVRHDAKARDQNITPVETVIPAVVDDAK